MQPGVLLQGEKARVELSDCRSGGPSTSWRNTSYPILRTYRAERRNDVGFHKPIYQEIEVDAEGTLCDEAGKDGRP